MIKSRLQALESKKMSVIRTTYPQPITENNVVSISTMTHILKLQIRDLCSCFALLLTSSLS